LKELVILAKTLNIPLQEVWDEVSRSNMSKISENGKVIKNEFGKIQKPSTFSPADIKSILQKHNLA
jgi:predicted HAD superfamily Cof-like phosphohydrolase